MLRNRTSRLGAAIGAALLSFSLATPAFAHDRDGWRGDGYRRGYSVHRHGDSCDHDRDGRWGHSYRHRHGDWRRHDHGWHDGRSYYGRQGHHDRWRHDD